MYKVIKILDKKTILIDYGKMNKAKVGEKIKIIKSGEDIYDLDGRYIGSLDSLKAVLEIVRVEEEFSLCQNIETKEVNPFAPAIMLKTTKIIAKELNIKEDEIAYLEYTNNEPITIGDIVKKY
ncbi:hypothetical protein SAMN02745174_02065 [Cetobacterium ceti]|uniref:Uncharacterized protein n=1 Tax=Cetobacterium ceti TaxID=180163 RepID=A0A1T4PW32_9FUSO|nr:hypothetical protein [Cetobacterium ceti]SJZ95507.1 hypothetical protein SAMN02745174_02065 [Cetobacterium ceti]